MAYGEVMVTSARSTPTFGGGISQRAVGKAMIVIGVLGIIVGIAAVIAGQGMIRNAKSSVDASLALTGEAVSAVKDSVSVTGTVVESVRTGMTNIGAAMTTLEASLHDASTTLNQGSEFVGGSLPVALDAVNGVLPTIQSVAKSVDDTLRLLSKVPFGPAYTPVEPFDEAIGRLTAALGPLPAQLRTLGGSFAAMTTTTSTMAGDIAKLGGDIDALNKQLGDVGVLLRRYADTAGKATQLEESSRRDLSHSANLARWLLILLGLVFTLGQVVPIWLGLSLLSGGVPADVTPLDDGSP